MINLIASLLTIYAWVAVGIVIYFLFAIGKFYEEKSGRRSYYPLFLISLVLFVFAAIRYAGEAPAITGDFWGDLPRFFGGLILGGMSFFLLRLMTGGR